MADARDPAYERAFLHYQGWLDRGMAADMSYLARHAAKKRNPEEFLTGVRSVVVVGAHYNAPLDSELQISSYAQGPDYHDVLQDKVQLLVDSIRSVHGGEFKTFVDLHPVMDRTWARLAGLGWIGKNTCLIHRKQGSYFFIAGFFTTLEIQPDAPSPEHCGRCRLCIDACPTGAILEPSQTGLDRHVVDSRKCISYHTIENRGEVPSEITAKLNGWVVGCDICQNVCPWNDVSVGKWFLQKNELARMTRKEAEALSEEDWKKSSQGTAISRLKYAQFQRNLKNTKS